jgi:hypothetical protein
MSKVTVTFIDEATSEPFATVDLPPADLPETFELETTLHLGNAEWSVVSAEPQTRAEYTRSGKLTLRLRRIEMVNPADLLFSLPSICDRIPGLGDTPLAGDELALAEDDWRQFEFVSRAFAAEADSEIASIRAIHEQDRTGSGWRRIHVRKRPDPPIASDLTLADIDRAFGGVTFRGVAYHGAGTRIASGFSFDAGGFRCYGIEEGGKVTVLGIAEVAGGASAEGLARLAREVDLDLVHWCRCARVGWDEPLFAELLVLGLPEAAQRVVRRNPRAADPGYLSRTLRSRQGCQEPKTRIGS